MSETPQLQVWIPPPPRVKPDSPTDEAITAYIQRYRAGLVKDRRRAPIKPVFHY